MLDTSLNIRVIDIFIILSIALFTTMLIASYRKQAERARLLKKFLGIAREKMKAEEDFNEIIKRIDGETE